MHLVEYFTAHMGLYFVLVLFCVGVCALVLEHTEDESPEFRAPRVPGFLIGGLVVLAAFIAFPSDPRTWSLGNMVLYLADYTLHPLRILGVLVLGGALFYGAVYALYLSRRR